MEIGVVIVTFNRLQKLKIALDSFSKQSKPPKYVVVVNNASTDGTLEFLQNWQEKCDCVYKKIVINCEKNTGGSGGFYTGLTAAIKEEADWIWVSDDDAYPERDTIKQISNFIDTNDLHDIGAICTSVYNKNGNIALSHRRMLRKGFLTTSEREADLAEYHKPYFDIDEFSYVGAVISKSVLEEVGVTNPKFFLYCDDTEHSLRIREIARILCVPSIRVIHDAPIETQYRVDWKKYYSVRNPYFTYLFRFPKRYSAYYYLSTRAKYYIKKFFKLRDTTELNIYKAALKDIKNKKMGINKVYRPGWTKNGRK